jgi:hypothetical protein
MLPWDYSRHTPAWSWTIYDSPLIKCTCLVIFKDAKFDYRYTKWDSFICLIIKQIIGMT